MSPLPPLPAGFQLDAAPASDTPALPPGFQLESTGGAATPPVGLVPGSREYADWAAQQARAGQTLPQVSPEPPKLANPGMGDQPDPSLWDRMGAFQQGAMQGMTLGFNDEIDAGLATPIRVAADVIGGNGFDIPRAFNDELANFRSVQDAKIAKAPGDASVGDVVGSLVTGKGAADAGLTLLNAAKPAVTSLVPRLATEGGVYGALNGFGRSDGDIGDRLAAGGEGALTGAGTGAVLGVPAGMVAKSLARNAVPTVEELKANAGQLYDQAKNSGMIFPQADVRQAAHDIASQAISDGIDPTLHPGAVAALKRLADASGAPMTVQDAQTMRRIIAAATKDVTNPDQSRIAGQMLDSFDNFVAKGAPELSDAASVYHQAKNGERIETAIELAASRAGQYSGSGFENALRTEFRAMDRQIIKGQLKGLSQDEIDAIRKVARGGPLENVARWIGKLAPTGVVSFGLGSGVPFAIGSALGGPGMGAMASGATMGAGFVGRAIATALAKGNADLASLVARGGPVASAAQGVGRVAQALLPPGVSELPKIPGNILRALMPQASGTANQANQ